MAKKHWSDVLSCHLCGKRFRSYTAEAYHRHNARFVCKGYPRIIDEVVPVKAEWFDENNLK